ncbi:MAG: family 10 glycosylhydrolase, partial [Candidatus Neomarinimicrobiota bacterium]
MRVRLAILWLMLSLPPGLPGQAENQEFRATWVVTWELISPGEPAVSNEARARLILDNHAAANMNAVLWQARQNGTAYYNSSFEPWGSYAGGGDPGYDPLAYAVEQAHARGLELHAWMNTVESRNPVPGSPSFENPDWVCRDGNGIPMPAKHALSPGLDTVRSYLVDVAMEIVRNYDIDGLHLDYIRWNEYTTSSIYQTPGLGKGSEQRNYPLDGVISPAALQALNEAASPARYLYDIDHPYEESPPDTFATWEAYWRGSVTEFVRTLHDSIQAVKPWVRLSVAALGNYNWGPPGAWNGYHRVYQDAALWYNEGYIDQLTPMHYHWVDGPSFRGMLLTNFGANWSDHIQPGIAAGRLFTVGPPSYKLDSQDIWGRHDEIVSQSRTVSFVDGFQFFSYGSWADRQYWETAGRIIFPAKTKIRPWGLLAANPPGVPTLALTQPDSLTVNLSVTPPGEAEGGHWYAIYRSEEAAIDSSSDRIVAVRLSDGAFDYQDEFNGLQDYNGTYTYAVSTLDRYWSESTPSNRVTSQAIPSLPPLVAKSSPVQGGTTHVEGPLSITFTKTMATGTLSGALHLTPAVGIGALSWSADQHSVQIYLAENLMHEADYELRIDSTVTDINGVALDGNSDGVAGDSYRLSFRAEAEDVSAPLVWSSYPELDGNTTSIMGDEVISIVYDEPVEPTSITDATLVLTRAGASVDLAYNLTNSGDRSVLSAQPPGGLLTNAAYELRIRSGIRDLLGNEVAGDLVAEFRTATQIYTATTAIDNFATTDGWREPDNSSFTTGIIAFLTTFSPSVEAFLPAATAPIQKRSAALHYAWDTDATEFLLNEYLSGAPRDIVFDSSYT